jgi:hypothetical protein
MQNAGRGGCTDVELANEWRWKSYSARSLLKIQFQQLVLRAEAQSGACGLACLSRLPRGSFQHIIIDVMVFAHNEGGFDRWVGLMARSRKVDASTAESASSPSEATPRAVSHWQRILVFVMQDDDRLLGSAPRV